MTNLQSSSAAVAGEAGVDEFPGLRVLGSRARRVLLSHVTTLLCARESSIRDKVARAANYNCLRAYPDRPLFVPIISQGMKVEV